MTTEIKFAERLTEIMFDRKISAENLAKIIGVNPSTVRDWKRGKFLIGLTNLIKLADALECSIDFLAGRDETILAYAPQKSPPFYERLRVVMEECGITRYRVVHGTRIGEASFSEWKQGKDPHINSLVELADLLEVSIDYLVGRDR